MKRLFLILVLALLAACASTSTDPRQQAVDSAYKTGVSLDASIVAARAAAQAGVLKGADAENAFKAFAATQAGLKAAQAALKAEPATPAASGATK